MVPQLLVSSAVHNDLIGCSVVFVFDFCSFLFWTSGGDGGGGGGGGGGGMVDCTAASVPAPASTVTAETSAFADILNLSTPASDVTSTQVCNRPMIMCTSIIICSGTWLIGTLI